MSLILRQSLQEFARTAVIEAISISELYQTALQKLYILITKVVLTRKSAMIFPKKYGYGVLQIIICAEHIPGKHNTEAVEFSRNPIEVTIKFGYSESFQLLE